MAVGIIVCADAGRIRHVVPEAIHPAEDGDDSGDGMLCFSWHFAVETNDAGFWATVPQRCVEYVKQCLTGGWCESDSAMVASMTRGFTRAWRSPATVSEALFSNLPYYAANGFRYSPSPSTEQRNALWGHSRKQRQRISGDPSSRSKSFQRVLRLSHHRNALMHLAGDDLLRLYLPAFSFPALGKDEIQNPLPLK